MNDVRKDVSYGESVRLIELGQTLFISQDFMSLRNESDSLER